MFLKFTNLAVECSVYVYKYFRVKNFYITSTSDVDLGYFYCIALTNIIAKSQ